MESEKSLVQKHTCGSERDSKEENFPINRHGYQSVSSLAIIKVAEQELIKMIGHAISKSISSHLQIDEENHRYIIKKKAAIL